jgi:hypothetical protein
MRERTRRPSADIFSIPPESLDRIAVRDSRGTASSGGEGDRSRR